MLQITRIAFIAFDSVSLVAVPCWEQGGDWFGSTLVGRIFFLWFGLAKKVWLSGCSLVEIWQYK